MRRRDGSFGLAGINPLRVFCHDGSLPHSEQCCDFCINANTPGTPQTRRGPAIPRAGIFS
jgi:hypothetical protein